MVEGMIDGLKDYKADIMKKKENHGMHFLIFS